MTPTRATLFDLDNTLLTNDMETFIPAYFELLASFAAGRMNPDDLIRPLVAATRVMAANTDPAVSNQEAFWAEFSRLTGLDADELIPFFARFYQTRFDELQAVTETRPEARPLVEWAFEQGYAVVIATNPMFPRLAVERRLAWAGLAAGEFNYELVTTYENMHATKPHPEYFNEILALLGCTPAETIMVGDDWERDIAPAAGLGIRTFWIAPPEAEVPDATVPHSARGTLADVRPWLETS